MAEYLTGAELPDLAITWNDSTGAPINFSSGWTFTVKLGVPGAAATVTKTGGITGASTAPNVTVSWSAGELDSLTPGAYTLQLFARHTATGKDRAMTTPVTIAPAIT